MRLRLAGESRAEDRNTGYRAAKEYMPDNMSGITVTGLCEKMFHVKHFQEQRRKEMTA